LGKFGKNSSHPQSLTCSCTYPWMQPRVQTWTWWSEVSDTACSRFGVEPAELSEIAVDRSWSISSRRSAAAPATLARGKPEWKWINMQWYIGNWDNLSVPGGWQVPSRGAPIRHSLQMSLKPATTRATTATLAGCIKLGLGHNMPFSGWSSRNPAEDDPRPNIPQLNTKGLTANKISLSEQLAYKSKAFMIVLQQTRCTAADKLVIPNFSLAESVLQQESRPCHVCPRAVGMVTGRTVSRTIRDWVVVRRRRRIYNH